MNIRSTTPVLKRFATSSLIVASAVSLVIGSTGPVFADRFDDQIRNLEGQISGYQKQAAKLREEANGLQAAIAGLQAQQDAIQAQIDLSQAKHDQLEQQIKNTQDKIEKNQITLSSTLADMYVSGDVSPIEMLASSKNIGDYLDQQEYRSSIRDKIDQTIKEIKKLKSSLEKKKAEVERVLNDQSAQKAQLVAKKQEQATLLAQTQGNEANYNALIGQQNSQISGLRAQQAAANAAASRTYSVSDLVSGGTCGGGYPSVWCNAPMDSLVDNWGMYNRECVSYAAFKVAASGRYMPYWGGYGNANQWPGNARAAGIPTGSEPRVGSVAVMNVGYYGHVMYVEGINGDGSIHVSQFNWGIRGEYSTMNISPSGLTFIYF
jgi:surface antigen/archaellum component FlaC